MKNDAKTSIGLSALDELLSFSYEEVGKLQFSLTKIRNRKLLLLAMFSAAHSHAESIAELLKHNRTHSADVLLRPLVETWINQQYAFIKRSDHHVAKFFLHDSNEIIKQADKMILFIRDNPSVNVGMDASKLREAVVERRKQIEKRLKIYSYDVRGLPNVRQRAEAIDEYAQSKRKKPLKHSVEWNYLVVYWYFSNVTHLNITGLGSFFHEGESGYEILVEGHPDEIPRIATTTFAYYLGILDVFSRKFGTPSQMDLKPFKEQIKIRTPGDRFETDKKRTLYTK